MTTITTVRAALRVIVTVGWTPRSLYQLGAAMGPATLYLLCSGSPEADAAGDPVPVQDDQGRLLAYTTPRLPLTRGEDRPPLRHSELTGAALLRLAVGAGCGLVLEPGCSLERTITARTVLSLQVAAGHTESLAAATGGRLAS
ncbi:MAG: hypothetical protein QM779_15965 [Propionicimonas sp.]|uniref:hypothetical protein n=1 Tax=Propionicimonas sp. TaxID=1955623 RepID=UPI003D0A4EDA